MNTPSPACVIVRSSLTFALALAIWAPLQAQSAMPAKDKTMMDGKTTVQAPSSEPAKGTMIMDGKMMERCQEMMKQKQKMMEEMKAQDAELTAQVASMNETQEGKKLGLLAAVVTRMVEQRTGMHAAKAKMEDEMMKHMMGHMQMGKESMSQCPMMKGMDEKPAGTHN